jgi:DNA-binding beta-propeller fold protein YncE
MIDISKRSTVTFLFPVLAALLACGGNNGGLNEGLHAPGDQPGGVMVGLGDIAVAPTDSFVIFERSDGLAVGWTGSGQVQSLPVRSPTRLAFSKMRSVVYVGSTDPSNRIVAVDVENRASLWSSPFDTTLTTSFRILSTADDRAVLAADDVAGTVSVFDAASGSLQRTFGFGGRIVDIQILPDDSRALVVLGHAWSGSTVTTKVVLVPIDGGTQKDISVPNCSDRVGISEDGRRAFLAPTTCRKDPISVIDLEPGKEKFVRNLPGFGPVGVQGSLAVGFLDRSNLDRSLFDDPSLIPGSTTARYHLMLIDTTTLGYEFAEAGDHLPRFAITPDGNVLLVDSSWSADVPARLFDVANNAWKFIDGAPLLLDNFVITSDSQHAYVIESRFFEGLYDLDIANGRSIEISLPFAPTNINISASDKTLYLRKDDANVCVFSLATKSCTRNLVARTF